MITRIIGTMYCECSDPTCQYIHQPPGTEHPVKAAGRVIARQERLRKAGGVGLTAHAELLDAAVQLRDELKALGFKKWFRC